MARDKLDYNGLVPAVCGFAVALQTVGAVPTAAVRQPPTYLPKSKMTETTRGSRFGCTASRAGIPPNHRDELEGMWADRCMTPGRAGTCTGLRTPRKISGPAARARADPPKSSLTAWSAPGAPVHRTPIERTKRNETREQDDDNGARGGNRCLEQEGSTMVPPPPPNQQ